MKQFFAIPAIIGAALTFSLAGCGKDPASSQAGSMKLSIKAMSGQSQAWSGSLAKVVAPSSPQARQVTITTAKVVLREIEVESSRGDSLDFMSSTPLVVNLDLTGGITNLGTFSLPFGTYDKLELTIDKLTPADGAVYTANPDLQNRSIYVRGYLDGDTSAVFTFTSDLRAEQEQKFSPPLVVDATTPQVNLMLTIDTRTWFSNRSGNFLDPRLSQNQHAIERNIKASINAFEDDDDNGEPDDDDGGTDDDDGEPDDDDGGTDDDDGEPDDDDGGTDDDDGGPDDDDGESDD
jgi:hypothetical protein